MGSNFQKCAFLETDAGGLEPRGRHIVEGQNLLESGDRKVILLGACGGGHVARRRRSCSLWDYEPLPATYGYSGRLVSPM